MKFAEYKLNEFVQVLSSKAPVPGGGGTSAFAGALGMALGIMVGSLTVGKKKYASVEEKIKTLMNEAEMLSKELLELMDKDAEVFAPLAAAYSLPKDDPSRMKVMEKCLLDACSIPLEIMRISCRAIELQRGFADMGSMLAVSDAGTGVAFCRSALCGGALNVKVNTRLMSDKKHAEEMNAEVTAMLDQYLKMADKIYMDVMEKLK